MERVARILFAKGGLDGHDAGSDIFVQLLRDSGFEVIYTSIYQSPEEIARQAIEEDPDIIGVSIHSGAHVRVFERLMYILGNTAGSAEEKWLVVGGGLIPESDFPKLKALGVREIFGSGASVSAERDIIPRLKEIAQESEKTTSDVPALWERVRAGERFAMSRFITMLEQSDARAQAVISLDAEGKTWARGDKLSFRLPMDSSAPHVVGLSGSGGVGKSSLIEQLLQHLYRDHIVAALCVDPVAAYGGAVLGDRCRIQDYNLTCSANVFIRSLAAHEPYKGVTASLPFIIHVLARAHQQVILVESVGAGQEDVRFNDIVDTFVYVASPAMGDHVQALKGGAIQKADVIVLNKSKSEPDKADAMKSTLEANFSHERGDGWTVPVIKTDAVSRVGIGDLWGEIENHKRHLMKDRRR